MKATVPAVIALALCALPVLPARPARGHVAPSRDTNNRYIKLTPMRDRVRLAYTVLLGEIPGAQARRQMDVNRDGYIDDHEAQQHVRPLAESVQQNLALAVEGTAHALSWSELHVGLGMPVVAGGAVSIDIIGWLCLGRDAGSAAAGRAHAITLHDRFRMPMPGETELHVQASPGIAITRSAIGPDKQDVRLAFQWHGSQVPLADQGHHLAFAVTPDAALLPAAGPCDAPPGNRDAPGWRSGLILILAALVLFLGATGAGWRWIRTQKTKG